MLRLSRYLPVAASSKGAVRAGKATLTRTSPKNDVGKKATVATAARAHPPPKEATEIELELEEDEYNRSEATHAAPEVQTGAQHHQQHHHDHRGGGKLHFDATKAGLQHVDREHVEQVIQEASKGSAFYQKEQRLDETRRRKAEELKEHAKKFDSLSRTELTALKAKVDALQDELESTRDLRRRYIHVDMDMFYAAVEEKKRPSLRGKPFGVGSNQMLSTTNYIARQYGVRSGMPGFIGKRLCPEMVIVPNDFPAYKREAARVHSIASRYDARFVSVGLDELTMDVTRYLQEFPAVSASDIAHDFRDEVFIKTQLTSSGGIGPTSILAKIASNVNKPNGQHEITLLTRDDVVNYVKDIPLRKIPGIGYAQELTLGALDIHTCGDLLANKYLLAFLFREKTFAHYLSIGLGVAETFSQRRHHTTQSIGKETSFYEPLASPEAFTKMFRKLMEECHVRCVREHLKPKSMRLVLKYRTYDSQQFSTQLPGYTNDLKLWLEAAQRLLDPHLLQYAELRLVGVRVERFEHSDAEGDPLLQDGTLTPDTRAPSNALSGRVTEEEEADITLNDDDAIEAAEDMAVESEHEENSAAAGEKVVATAPAADKSADSKKKKKAPIPISKFFSKPRVTVSMASTGKVASSPVQSVKAARKHLKVPGGGAKRKLSRRR